MSKEHISVYNLTSESQENVDLFNSYPLGYSFQVIYFFIAIFAMVGNGFIWYVIHKTPKLKTTTFKLLKNMSYADFYCGLVIFPEWYFCSYNFLDKFGARACLTLKSSQIMGCVVTTYSIMFIAADRYQLIKHPYSGGLKISARTACIASWIVAFVLSTSLYFDKQVDVFFGPKSINSCRLVFPIRNRTISLLYRRVRILLFLIGQLTVPLITITILYYQMSKTILKVSKMIDERGNRKSNVRQFQNDKKRQNLIKMLIMVVVVFLISWLPIYVFHIEYELIAELQPERVCYSSMYYVVTWMIGMGSCSFNFFIYYWYNPDFRNETLNIFYRLTCRKREIKVCEDDMKEISTTIT